MSSSLQPRGPLPARVYWVRRLIVVGVAVLLVVLVAQLLGGSSDGASESEGQAATVSTETSTETSETTSPTSTTKPRTTKPRGAKEKPRTRLARPDGPCEDSDVLVEPVVGETPEAGRDVRIRLRLRTREAAACTWQVSRDTVTVSITSGDDDIWSSRECPKAIPTEDVVLRSAKATRVVIAWNARRSDDECSEYTNWAMPGWYHVQAAALAGEPTDVAFELVRPVSETITKTITPEPRPKPTKTEETKRAEKQAEEPSEKPSEESTEHRAGDDGGGNSDG